MLACSTMAARRPIALGFSVHTGRAFIIALGGPLDAPAVLAKTLVQVASTFEEGAVFHTAEAQPLAAARKLVASAEVHFVKKAARGLRALVDTLDGEIVAAAMTAKAAKPAPPLESILKAHTLIHAAEGELYRRVYTSAASELGFVVERISPDTVTAEVASALELSPAAAISRLAAMGKASGKPWAADQKAAALAAWWALARASSKRASKS